MQAATLQPLTGYANKFSGMLKRGDILSVDALGLKDGEEIFRHHIVVTVPTS